MISPFSSHPLRRKARAAAAGIAVAAFLLVSCAGTPPSAGPESPAAAPEGTGPAAREAGDSVEEQRGDQAQEQGAVAESQSQRPEAYLTVTESREEKGGEGNVRITAQPREARIYIDGREVGEAPLTVSLEKGSYRVSAEKKLHFRMSAWITIHKTETLTEVEIRLVPKTGTLDPVVRPGEAQVRVGGAPVEEFPIDLPEGSYTIRAELFGYKPLQQTVNISPGQTSAPVIELSPADFAIEELRTALPRYVPLDPGSLGTEVFVVKLSAPANIEAIVTDPLGRRVYRTSRTARDAPTQRLPWRPRAEEIAGLETGRYTIELTATSTADGEVLRESREFSLNFVPRGTLFSGLSGGAMGETLLAPTALLPHGGLAQVSLMSMAGTYPAGDSTAPQWLPQLLSASWSVTNTHQIGLTGGMFLRDGDSPSPSLAVSYCGRLLPALPPAAGAAGETGSAGAAGPFAAAATAGYAYRPGPGDLPGLYDGFRAGIAGTLHSSLRRPAVLSASLAPEMLMTPSGGSLETRAVVRGALAIETPHLGAAISAAGRSAPLGQGFSAQGPLALGAELKAVIPGSSVALSLFVLGEADTREYSFYGGLGAQYLFSLPGGDAEGR